MSGNGEAGEGGSKILKLQLQYALEHFKFHAQQRTTMFHFFLIAIGLLVNAIALFIKEKLFVPAGVLALVGAFISWGFSCLDRRNAYLVSYGEHVLKFLEEKQLFKGEKYEGVTLGFMLREDRESETPEEKAQDGLKHSVWILRIQRVVLVVFLLIAVATFLAPTWLRDQMSNPPAAEKPGTAVQSGEPQSGSKP